MKARYKASCAIAAILSGWASASIAADSTTAATSTAVEEIVVTAQRRDESVENVPLTVQAFTGQTLTTFNVLDLQDLLKFTPNVSYGNNGPGQGNIFMRGLSAGFAGNQSSATAGNFPNVALYLDEESMQFPARNVDIYVVDMDRIEVLEGPQGTLFGGGAEAGALRYITNKPKLDLFEGNAEASYGFTAHGDPNAMGNVTLNIPLVQDKLAQRAQHLHPLELGPRQLLLQHHANGGVVPQPPAARRGRSLRPAQRPAGQQLRHSPQRPESGHLHRRPRRVAVPDQ
jgi:outer membrane receptor protein involved in Fe transport